MRFRERFKRLTLWNKLGFIGAVASIVSMPLSTVLFFLSLPSSQEKVTPPESKVDKLRSRAIELTREKEAEIRVILRLLAEREVPFTHEELNCFNQLLGNISYEDVANLVKKLPEQPKKMAFEQLISSKQMTAVMRIVGLTWNGDPLSVKYMRLNDSSLDLTRVGFYTTDTGIESTKNLDLPGLPYVSVMICETHLLSRRRLELLVIRQDTA
jgi:Zn-dependent M16 (insulinase) family peptidase